MFIPSVISTVKLQLFLLFALSLYVYVTVLLPTGKKSLGLLVLDTKKKVPELSVTVGSCQVTCLPVTPKATSNVRSPGQVTTGGVLSTEKEKHQDIFWFENVKEIRKQNRYCLH